MIAIIDYGMGNIHSVQKALEACGAKGKVTHKPQDIRRAKKIVLPGVGAFDDCLLELQKQGLVAAIKEAITRDKKPFLGICLGMQILFEASEEASRSSGLGLFKGVVKKFGARPALKVPHMGWNQLKIVSGVKCQVSSGCLLLKGIPDNSCVYFCHSYYPLPKDKAVIAATCDYGAPFAAVVCKDNLYGVQFHPEKSQSLGLKILKNFVEIC
jgi:glutamine amidotransferase